MHFHGLEQSGAFIFQSFVWSDC